MYGITLNCFDLKQSFAISDLSPEAEDLMKNMALQTEADLNVGPIKVRVL